MSYRDDLGQAHRRIEQLEGELRDAKAPKDAAPKARASRPAFVALVVATFFVGLGAVIAVAVTWTRHAPVRVVASADQLVRHPDQYVGKQLRVQGDLVVGTLVKVDADDKCELRFTVERDHLRLPMRLGGCVAPDAFHDVAGVMVAADGELQRDGTFAATQLFVTRDFPNMP